MAAITITLAMSKMSTD